MKLQLIPLLILAPFVVCFVYATIHEYLRYKSDGRATYGLVYDEESGTTHVTGIGEGEEAYDPEDFDPNSYNDPESGGTLEDERDDKTA